MNRGQALAKARSMKAIRRERDAKINREIIALRREVGIELGRSSFGASGINLSPHAIQEEYVPELFTLHGRLPILERMANDPAVRGQLNAIYSALISGVRWKVEGGEPEQKDLVAANLLREGDPALWCLTSWNDRLFETLGCLIHGFSIFGKTWEPDVDGYAILRDIKWLHPRSLQPGNMWNMDAHDNLISVRRQYRDGLGKTVTEELPADRVFLVPWDRRGPNWEGNAYIRPMYKPWKMRELAEKIDIIDLMNRGVGIPLAKLSAQGGVKERDQLKSILANMRLGSKEQAFIVIGNDEEIKFLTSEGTARDAQPVLDGKAADISRVGMTQYLEAGNTQSGSRASSSSMSTGFFINVDSIRERLQDIINFGAGPLPGLVEELQNKNFDRPKEYTRIVGSRVSPTEQLDNIPMVGEMVAKGAIPAHFKLANDLLKRLGYEQMSQGEYDDAMQRPVPSIGGRPTSIGTDEQGRDDTMSRRLAARLTEAPARRREPTPEEAKVLALTEIDAGLDQRSVAYADELKSYVRLNAKRIADTAAQGIDTRAILTTIDSVMVREDATKQRLLAIMKGVRDFGRQQVQAELTRQ